uniref:SGNH hydrolase-type esterase domain-containing protein n=1 Tax=Setaria italica TaxID=4555 RepID=K3ZNH0_SETIT
MASFSCQQRSVSQRIFLVSVVLLLNASAGLCSCYKRIFSFGDSIIDTGNFANGKGPLMEFPFGMTYFKRPTGRICDGRVLIDFYAQALQLPLVPPNLPEKDTGLFPNGANFAVFGSTAMPPEYFRRFHHSVPLWCHLGMQMGWFKDLMHRIAPNDDAKRRILSESLIVLGEIGGNDYNYWFSGNMPREQAAQFTPDIMATIGSSIQELINMGAKVIMVPNNFPIGCVPASLSRYRSNNRADYDELGCLRWYNDFSQRHNQELRRVVDGLAARNPGVKLIYADYYGAAMEFIRDPHRNCDRTARIWGNPSSFASWDGVHMTEKAYEVIARGVLDGPFANPPLLRACWLEF